MQPIRKAEIILRDYSDEEHFIYTQESLRRFFPEMTNDAYFKLLSRIVKAGLLTRVCKGVYLYPYVTFPSSKVLSYVAGILRADYFSYLSLESVLSAESIISQQLMNWITVVTNGREGIIKCGTYGTIEFVHKKIYQDEIMDHLIFDTWTGMFIADSELAIKDMKQCRRHLVSLIREE